MALPVNRMIAAVVTALVLTLSTARAQSPEGSTADDTARLLAGLPPSSNSPLAVLTKNSAWLSHARYFDQIFAKQSAHLSKVREFSKEYLTDKHDTMLYLFSGPDFLYATSFFPNAATYVLAGLEPVGQIPDLTSLSPWAINGELRNLETSMGSLFNFSFFITQNMKTHLREGPVYGTLPILYVFLARTGKTIHELNLVSLDEQGNVQIADDLVTNKAARSAAPGVKIVFSDSNGPNQTLYYFSTNLADGSFERSDVARSRHVVLSHVVARSWQSCREDGCDLRVAAVAADHDQHRQAAARLAEASIVLAYASKLVEQVITGTKSLEFQFGKSCCLAGAIGEISCRCHNRRGS